MMPSSNQPSYPQKYVSSWTARDGRSILIRPICQEDESAMIKFHESLSERSVYLRYFSSLSLRRRVDHKRLARICFVDYKNEMVLIAEPKDGDPSGSEIMAVARMNKFPSANEAEVAVLVSDRYQKLGLGHELLRRVIEVARDEQIGRVSAETMLDNIPMQIVMKRLGFRVEPSQDPGSIRAVLDL